MRDALGRFVQPAAIDDLFGRDIQLDDAIETGRAGEVENRIRLRLGKNERGGMCLLQAIEAAEQPDLRVEVEGRTNAVETHRFQKKFLALAGEELTVRNNRA